MAARAHKGDAARSERTTVHFLPCTPQHKLVTPSPAQEPIFVRYAQRTEDEDFSKIWMRRAAAASPRPC